MFAALVATVLSIQAADHRDHRCCCTHEPQTYLGVVESGGDGGLTRVRFTLLSPVECPHASRLKHK